MRSIFPGVPWSKNVLTYSVTKYTPDLSRDDVDAAFRQAFDIWEEHANLRFVEVKNNTKADLVIFFSSGAHGDGVAFDGPGRVLAHAWFPNGQTNPNEGDCHLDEDENWAIDDNPG